LRFGAFVLQIRSARFGKRSADIGFRIAVFRWGCLGKVNRHGIVRRLSYMHSLGLHGNQPSQPNHLAVPPEGRRPQSWPTARVVPPEAAARVAHRLTIVFFVGGRVSMPPEGRRIQSWPHCARCAARGRQKRLSPANDNVFRWRSSFCRQRQRQGNLAVQR